MHCVAPHDKIRVPTKKSLLLIFDKRKLNIKDKKLLLTTMGVYEIEIC